MDEGFDKILDTVNAAVKSMYQGDPGPHAACWAKSDDVTLFGALGTVELGWQAVTDTMRWVGDRIRVGGQGEIEHRVIARSGDLAYTVGFERRRMPSVDGRMEDMTLRVTHIYRRLDGEWKLVHRHADRPPSNPRARPRE